MKKVMLAVVAAAVVHSPGSLHNALHPHATGLRQCDPMREGLHERLGRDFIARYSNNHARYPLIRLRFGTHLVPMWSPTGPFDAVMQGLATVATSSTSLNSRDVTPS